MSDDDELSPGTVAKSVTEGINSVVDPGRAAGVLGMVGMPKFIGVETSDLIDDVMTQLTGEGEASQGVAGGAVDGAWSAVTDEAFDRGASQGAIDGATAAAVGHAIEGVVDDAADTVRSAVGGVGESVDGGFEPDAVELGRIGDEGFSPEGVDEGFVSDEGFSPDGIESAVVGDGGFVPEPGVDAGFVDAVMDGMESGFDAGADDAWAEVADGVEVAFDDELVGEEGDWSE